MNVLHRGPGRFYTLLLLCLLLAPALVFAQKPIGIDVSKWQASINWTTVKNSGITFAWAKATQGASTYDEWFTNNAVNAKAAGMPIGFYHYAESDLHSAATEAAHFWAVAGTYIKGDGKTIMPMLDMEGGALSGHVGATTVSQWVDQWCIAVSNYAAAVGMNIKPLIYVSACNASAFDSTVAKWTPWIANYNGQDPQTGTPWSVCSGNNEWGGWTVWQYTSSVGVPGISGNVDHDVFNGTTNQMLSTLVIAGNSASVVSANVPVGVLPGQNFTATITFKNEGTSSWTNSGANAYKLGSQSPQDNLTWGTNRFVLPSSPIAPGQNVTFTLPVTAPVTPGNYTFAWQMVQEGVQWFGNTFSTTVHVGNSAAVVSANVPAIVSTGQTFTATIVMKNDGGTIWTNSGATPYRLGSQTPANNTTWGTNRAWLTAASVNPSNNATFTFSAKAPANVGTFTFAWRMLQEPSSSFGTTFTTNISVVLPGPGATIGSYTVDTNMDSTSRNGSYVSTIACGLTNWYSFGVPGTSNCTVFNRDIRWMPTLPAYGFTGRGFLYASMNVPSDHASAAVKFTAVDAGGNDSSGPVTGVITECPYSCTYVNFFSGTVNISGFGGWRSNTQDDSYPPSGCNAACGSFAAGYSRMTIQGARWHYINDFTCLGGYPSASTSDTSGRGFSEANLYLYPALDTSHGNVIGNVLGYNSKTPGRITTGDCNNANTLDFKGNANAFGGGDGMDSYGFAWIFSPTGAVPRFVIGSDDGNRLWVNGTLRNDVNTTRTLTRDQDTTAAVTLPAGWSRVLFKVHNVSSTFQGTISLRNGTNSNLNAPAMNVYDFGGYYSYGLGYEQDAWYPQIVVSNIYGANLPANGSALYGSNTTVTANGASNGQGPVPLARTMQYQWGNDLNDNDTDYADVSGTPTSANWSHTTTEVSGHRRFHFFAVSQSGRTSFQANGLSGGALYQDAGNYARYYDLFIDNLPPLDPAFGVVAAASTTQINLNWTLPLDQGANIDPGATESAGAAGNDETQNWYRVGDVGLQLYRDSSVVSAWGSSTTLNDSGLVPNTAYIYSLEARDNNSSTRGNWHNSTGPVGSVTAWTLSLAPGATSISASDTNANVGSNVTWTAVSGFGPGQVQYYRYIFDQSPTHTFTGAEPQWNAGTITTVPSASGTWYLHVRGYNGADVANGTYDYAINATQVVSEAPQILTILNSNNVVTVTWSSVSGSVYRLEYSSDLSTVPWSNIPPDIQATATTATASDDAGTANQRFYRVELVP